nr:hypothetical protein [Tanacetum cinerariifolium]
MTKLYSSHHFIANCFIAGNIKGEWRYEYASPVSPKAQDGGDRMMMNRDYAWLMISRFRLDISPSISCVFVEITYPSKKTLTMNPEQHQSFPGSFSQGGCNRGFKIVNVARVNRLRLCEVSLSCSCRGGVFGVGGKPWDDVRLQALVDKKKVVVTEATIREALHIDDAEDVDYLPNEEIFAKLARMGDEKPSPKLTFYKAFFSSHLVRNVDSTTKFYMYPRFLKLIIRNQVGDLSTHTINYTSPTLTQKNKRLMKKDADENVEEVNAGDATAGDDSVAHGEVPTVTKEPSIPSPTPPTPTLQPPQDISSTSQGRMIVEMDQDDAVVLEDDKEKDKEVVD